MVKANVTIKKILEDNPAYHAHVVYDLEGNGPGWDAPEVSSWLAKSIDIASNAYFGRPCAYWGEGPQFLLWAC